MHRILTSLPSNCSVAVIGASGGIGNAFVRILASDDNVGDIHAFSRTPNHFGEKSVHGHRLDLTDEASIEAAADVATASLPLDLVIVASGILHRDSVIRPEKSMGEINSRSLEEVFAVNTIGPALVAKHFLPKLSKGHKTVFAALSARVGSIGDNRLGGWVSYRMSKAALNMLLKTASIEPSKLFSPAHSAEALLKVIDSLEPGDSGGFFAYDSSRIDY